MQDLNETAHKVLDVAEKLTQLKGFNAFSYRDLQKEVGVKTATIHYYFPTKRDLALRMTERYVDGTRQLLANLDSEEKSGLKRLEILGQLYVDMVSEGKFCMCGMLASDMLSLPEVVHDKLRDFFNLLEKWVEEAIKLGQAQGTLKTEITQKDASTVYLGALEGGMLLARIRQNPGHLENMIREILTQYIG